MHNNQTKIGITNWRNENKPFYIKDEDRLGHIYAIGKTGVGKSTLLLNMAISDIQRGNGLCVIDPHGDLVETILNHIPKERVDDVIYFNPKDRDYPIGFNPLKSVHPNFYNLVASGLISTFKKIWSESWGPRLEYILKFCLLTLLEYPDATLIDIQPLLTNAKFRENVLRYVKNQHTIAFWKDEFEKYNSIFRNESISPILNKTGVFITSKILRNIVGQQTRTFRMQNVIDGKKILLVNLSKGEIGEDVSAILGNIIINSIQLSASYRATIPEKDRVPFYLYIDEMHSFVSLSLIDILSEARKYKLSIFLTHQYLDQINEKIRNAILGNVGTLLSFRVGAKDADVLEKEFHPIFNIHDLINLPRYTMYLKLMINGASSRPFSAFSLPPTISNESHKQEIIEVSRKKYSRNLEEIEKHIFSKLTHEKEHLNQSALFDSI
jgi:hypothetical protein